MDINNIKNFCFELLVASSVPANEAALLMDSLIAAELKGVSSHGLNRLPIYIKRIKAGLLKAKAEIEMERESGAIAVINGNFSIGQVVAHRAMEIAVEKATQYGIAAVLVKNGSHFGMASEYGLQAARQKMIGVVTSNVTPLMPAPGGSTKLIGNNPFAIVAPTAEDPIIADMAMSNVAYGKLISARNQGKKIPADWAVDKFGQPTDDPEKGLAGMLLPMAGPKGYSLAVALEILTGVFGGSFAWKIPSVYDLSKAQAISQMMIAIDIQAFVPFEEYLARIEEFRLGIKNSPRAEGTKELFLPGEIELQKQRDTLSKDSISIPDNVIAELNQLAKEAGMARLLEHSDAQKPITFPGVGVS